MGSLLVWYMSAACSTSSVSKRKVDDEFSVRPIGGGRPQRPDEVEQEGARGGVESILNGTSIIGDSTQARYVLLFSFNLQQFVSSGTYYTKSTRQFCQFY